MVDVTNHYSVGSIRRMALAATPKHEAPVAPEDGFFVKFSVSSGKVILDTGEINSIKSAETEEFSKAQLLKKTKAELVEMLV